MKICPHCAELIQDAATTCRFCDEMLTQRPTGQAGALATTRTPGGLPGAPDSDVTPLPDLSPVGTIHMKLGIAVISGFMILLGCYWLLSELSTRHAPVSDTSATSAGIVEGSSLDFGTPTIPEGQASVATPRRARSDIVGWGNLVWGSKIEAAKALYPKHEHTLSGLRLLDVDVPGFLLPYVYLDYTATGLAYVAIEGRVIDQSLFTLLGRKYGEPSVDEERWNPLVGKEITFGWYDAAGRSLFIRYFPQSAKAFLAYRDSERTERHEEERLRRRAAEESGI